MCDEVELARLAAQQREVGRRIDRFRAADRLSRDELHERERLEETLAVLSDPALMAQIRASEQAIADGDFGVPLADLRIQPNRPRDVG